MLNKAFILIFCTFFILLGCLKENGKKEYLIQFTFDSGETIETNCLLYEKTKHYDDQIVDGFIFEQTNKNTKTVFVKGLFDHIQNPFLLTFIKVEHRQWKNIGIIELPFESASFSNLNEIVMKGGIELESDFRHVGRKYSVENGQFSFDCYSSTDASLEGQNFSGTWTLKRSK